MIIDENKYVAAILMDLSKALDDLLLLKLKSFRLSNSALNLMESYLKTENSV